MVQNAFQMVGGSVGFSGLFLTGIVALWYTKFSEKHEAGYLFWYGLLMTIFIINPVNLMIIAKYFPLLVADNYYMWIVPTVPIILYAAVSVFEHVKTNLQKLYFTVGIVVLLLLAATTSYAPSTHPAIDNNAYIEPENYQVLQILSEYQKQTGREHLLLWGDARIMESVPKVKDDINCIYGRDLWEGVQDLTCPPSFREEDKVLYRYMQSPAAFLEEIAESAINREVTVLVLSKTDFQNRHRELPNDIGERYLCYRTTENFGIYILETIE